MRRPKLHVYIAAPVHGVVTARAELETPTGPVQLTASVPVALIRALLQVHRSEGIGADDPEVGSLWGSITHAVREAAHVVTHSVVAQAVGLIRATRLPQLMGTITKKVAAITGKIPGVAQVTRIFDVTAQALLGKASAKDLLKSLKDAALKNPLAWVALETAKLTAKVLPAVRKMADPIVRQIPGVGKAALAAADAFQAATQGDLKSAWGAALNAAPLVPGLGQAVAVYKMADAVRRGQWEDLAKGALSMSPQGAIAVQAYDTARGVLDQSKDIAQSPGGARQALATSRAPRFLPSGAPA